MVEWYNKKQQNVLAHGIMCGDTLTCFIWERLQPDRISDQNTPPEFCRVSRTLFLGVVGTLLGYNSN